MATLDVSRALFFGFAWLVALSGPARAQERDRGPVSIDWRAPSGCPDRFWVQRDVYRLLGGKDRGLGAAHLSARADVVERADGRWQVVLSTLRAGRRGKRELTAESCAAVASATALIVAMMIDPHAIAWAEASDSAARSELAPAAVPARAPPSRDRAPPAVRPTRSPWRGFAGPVLALHTGLAPGWPLAGGARLGLRSGGSAVSLQGLYSPNTLGRSQEDPALRGRFAVLTAGLRGCQTSAGQVLKWGGCVSADYNRIRAVGDAADPLHNWPQTAQLWTFGASGVLALRAGDRVTFPVTLEMLVPTRRPEFVFQRRATVYQPAGVVGRASFATELCFP